MIKSKEHLINTVDAIILLEARAHRIDQSLINHPTEEETPTVEDSTVEVLTDDVLSIRNRCQLFYMLATSYLKIIKFCRKDINSYNKMSFSYRKHKFEEGQENKAIPPSWEDVIISCEDKIKKSLELAAQNLEITDPLRLMCVHATCDWLCIQQEAPRKAYHLAESTVSLATMHGNELTEKLLGILERLRADFMTEYSTKEEPSKSQKKNINVTKLTEGAKLTDMDLDRIFTESIAAGTTTTAAASSYGSTPGSPAANRSRKFKVEEEDKGKKKKLGREQLIERNRLANFMMAKVNLSQPIIFETISSAAAVMRAMEKIFRIYVRGNALPGLMQGDQRVDLNKSNRPLQMSSFILDGPYMSFKGFFNVLVDFGVTKPPNPNTNAGKSFIRHQGNMGENITAKAAATSGMSQLVTISEAAALFIEASAATKPALCIAEHEMKYQESAKEEKDDTEGSPSSWELVANWLQDPLSHKHWDIRTGLNFMRFVDCLGKIGVFAYSSETNAAYRDLLPTPRDKAEHFVTAYMGFADVGRWHQIVESKLRIVKSLIARIKSGKFEKEKL